MPSLAEKFTVIAPDLRGWGESDKPNDGYDIYTLSDDIHEFIQTLKLDNVNIIGHDWGAPVGYAVAARYQDRIKTLTLIEASMPGIGGENLLDFSEKWTPLWFFPFLATPELSQQLITGKEKQFYEWILRHMAVNPDVAFTQDDLDHYVSINSAAGISNATFQYYSNVYKTAAQIKELSKSMLSIPVMVVGAERSLGNWMIDAVRNAFAPQARGFVMQNCGHVIPEEKPEELLPILYDFFLKNQLPNGRSDIKNA